MNNIYIFKWMYKFIYLFDLLFRDKYIVTKKNHIKAPNSINCKVVG